LQFDKSYRPAYYGTFSRTRYVNRPTLHFLWNCTFLLHILP
jgi:hypothetical protein